MSANIYVDGPTLDRLRKQSVIATHSYYNNDTTIPSEVLNVASITVRNLDDGLNRRLRIRAAENGKSMEQEARDILRAALDEAPPTGSNLASAIRARFAPLGGVELELSPRNPAREPPQFD